MKQLMLLFYRIHVINNNNNNKWPYRIKLHLLHFLEVSAEIDKSYFLFNVNVMFLFMFHKIAVGIQPLCFYVGNSYQDVNISKATFQITLSLREIYIVVSVTRGRLDMTAFYLFYHFNELSYRNIVLI